MPPVLSVRFVILEFLSRPKSESRKRIRLDADLDSLSSPSQRPNQGSRKQDGSMKRSRFTEEQITMALKQAEAGAITLEIFIHSVL